MSIDASVRVLARLIEHEAFRVQLADDPEGSLAGLDLSDDERRMLAAAAHEDLDTLLQPHLGLGGEIARLAEYLSRPEHAPLVRKETRDDLARVAIERLERRAARDRDREVRDRTAALEQANQRLRELDELKSNFFANINHELRTPLTLILAPVRRMLQAAAAGSELARDLEVVQRNADMLLKLVNDLLDLSKLDAGKLELSYARVELGALARLVASHFELTAADRKISLRVDARGTTLAEVDRDKLVRVLTNLVGNALKFTPNSGSISVGVRREGDLAVINVGDSGPGIPPGERARVFERFHQLDTGIKRALGGTGLGLAIVRDFVHLHRGDVAVGQAREGGALFTVTLPLRAPDGSAVADAPRVELDLSAETAAHREQAEPFYPFEFGRPLVLVVEDNPDMRAYTAGALAAAYNVVTADNGEAGLRSAVAERPDLIVTDLMLPVVSGDELLAQLRARPEFDNTPVLVLTAKADERMRVHLLRSGAADYLIKPFAPEELLARVENQIAARIARELLQRELGSESRSLVELAREARGLRNAPPSDSSRISLADLQRNRQQ